MQEFHVEEIEAGEVGTESGWVVVVEAVAVVGIVEAQWASSVEGIAVRYDARKVWEPERLVEEGTVFEEMAASSPFPCSWHVEQYPLLLKHLGPHTH